MLLWGRRHLKKILISLLVIVIAASTALYLWIFYDMPNINNIDAGLALPSTRIYDRHGELLYEILPPEQGRNRVIPLDDIPLTCINAIVATEDANYWSHAGVDPEGIARAVWINLRGGDIIAGGSTITQQTARILLFDFSERANKSVRRKLREMVLAIQLQNATSKEHVLGLYFNQVYFGNLAYGIEAAAQTYFQKSAAELSLAECSLLTGIVQNPVYYDPLSNIENAKARQAVVLGLMVDNEYIAQSEADSAQRDELQFGAYRFPIDAPHFVMAVWKQLEREYPDQLYGGGLDVITTVDLSWQETAEVVVRQALDNLNHPQTGNNIPANANNAAVVALDPYTGQVLTMLGSPDYFDESIDGNVNATLALRQPGSTLKPFTYALAMNPERAEPYSPATVLLDVETPFVTRRLESYTPGNYGLVEHGPVSIREALGSSYNIPAVLALEDVGIEEFIEFAANIGLDSLASNPNLDLAITLGGGEVRLIDLVQAYSIFPNGGYRVEPTYILKVTTRDGDVLQDWQPERLSKRVLDARVAYLITDILSDNDARIPSFGVNSALQIGRESAAKTGTTTDFRDNWVVGYTPDLVVGVWVGNADNTPMVEVTGVSGAGPIYNNFMRRVLVGRPETQFQRPDGLVRVEVCNLSGMLPKPNCPLRSVDWFIAGAQPTDYDTVYQDFAIDTRTGQLADETTPDDFRRVETYVVLPQQAHDWAREQGLRFPPVDGVLQSASDKNAFRLLEPDPYTVFELSPLIPQEAQQIRLRVAVPEDAERVDYYINDEMVASSDTVPFNAWWMLDVGRYDLYAEATLSDGTTQRTALQYFSVDAYEVPQERTISTDGETADEP